MQILDTATVTGQPNNTMNTRERASFNVVGIISKLKKNQMQRNKQSGRIVCRFRPYTLKNNLYIYVTKIK